ncbi:MAG: DUF4011 domain-containing protein, partial [Rhodothermales bacterium]|nr:DUF4011 domain-containing protein [Rhodothermales bacterium]
MDIASPSENCLEHPIARRLEIERQDVLDLSANSRLLNFRELRSRGARVIDERADVVYRQLVEEEKSLRFEGMSTPDEVREAGPEDPPFSRILRQPALAEISPSETAVEHQDLVLKTPYSDGELQRRLLNTYYSAQRIVQERGVNILFLALGFLEWTGGEEEDSPQYRAPLILIPVEIGRASSSSRFEIRYTGEDLGTNLSLAERLRIDNGPLLPPFEVDIPVDDYLNSVANMDGLPSDWSVIPDIALDFFSYTRFQIYQDLDPRHWCHRILGDQHAVGRMIGSDSFAVEFAPPYDFESNLDETIKAEDIIHVADADSSQMVAIRRVLDGKDLIIQGPPGTGKSQTITNIIAACVAAGKRVLFVSEKRAALDVVYNNLSRIGLDRVALQLHSHRANKKVVLRELERTLHSRPARDAQRNKVLHALHRFKDKLQDYSASMAGDVDDFSASVVSVVEEMSSARERLDGFEYPAVVAGEFEGLTAQDLVNVEGIASEMSALLSGNIGLPIDHPFWGTGHTVVASEDETELRRMCDDVLARLEDVAAIASQLTEATGGRVG